jgi:hypothetical protein
MTKKQEEGQRAFGALLTQVDDGTLHDEATSALHALNTKLAEHAERYGAIAKGAITLKLSIAMKPNGTAEVSGEIVSKEPKAPKAGSVFWLTKGNNLSPDNPRQQKLPLREVPKADRVVELDELGGDVRSV